MYYEGKENDIGLIMMNLVYLIELKRIIQLRITLNIQLL